MEKYKHIVIINDDIIPIKEEDLILTNSGNQPIMIKDFVSFDRHGHGNDTDDLMFRRLKLNNEFNYVVGLNDSDKLSIVPIKKQDEPKVTSKVTKSN